jgi:hypothetical protein
LALILRSAARLGWISPSQPYGEAFDNDARGTVRMEPRRRESRICGKAVEVDGFGLESRQKLLDDAFEVVEIELAS